MTKMFKIALPDGSVREMPEGSTPGGCRGGNRPRPGQGGARGAGRRRIARPQPPVRGGFRARFGHQPRRTGRARARPPRFRPCPRRGGAVPVSRAPRSPSARRPTTASIMISRRPPGRGPFTEEDLPAIEEEMRRVIAADKPLVREVWTREDVRALFEKQGESFKAEWVMELPDKRADHDVQDRPWRRPTGSTCAAARTLPRPASSTRSAFKLTRVSGRLLARRPQEPDAEPDLRHRLAQQEAARRLSRPARGSGQARPSQDRPGNGPVPPPARSPWQRLLAPQRLHPVAPARGLYAPPARRRRLSTRSRPRS